MKQTRTLNFEKIYDSTEDRCKFMIKTNDGMEGPLEPKEIAEKIRDYLEQMEDNHSNAKISVSFREEV